MFHSDDASPSVMSTDLPAGVYLLDVREDDEWAAGHAPEAVHIPVGALAERAGEIPAGPRGVRDLPVRRPLRLRRPGPGGRRAGRRSTCPTA